MGEDQVRIQETVDARGVISIAPIQGQAAVPEPLEQGWNERSPEQLLTLLTVQLHALRCPQTFSPWSTAFTVLQEHCVGF